MKKIISVVLTAAMICLSAVSAFAVTELSADVAVTARELTEAEKTQFAALLTGTNKGYVIEMDMSNFGNLTQETDSLFGEISGRKLTSAQMKLTVDDSSKVARIAFLSSALAAKSALSVSSSFVNNEANYMFSKTGGEAYPTVDGTVTSIDNMFAVLVIVSDSVVITPTVTLGVLTYSADAAVANSEEQINDKALTALSLTVGGEEEEEEITVKNETVTGYTGEKTLIYVAKVLQKADANKKVVLTKNGETQNSYRTLAEILGGVAAPGGVLSGDVAIGVLTNDTTATFGFELVD